MVLSRHLTIELEVLEISGMLIRRRNRPERYLLRGDGTEALE
jgi:hypothetical protein